MINMKKTNLYALKSTPGKQTGLSLIELMIASVIGLVILGGAVTIFSSNSASSKLSTGMARVQDNGRVALDIISYSTRMTGYEGCRDEVKDPAIVLATVRPSTLAANMTSASAGIVLPNNPDQLAADDMVMIADCETTEIFRAER